MTTTRPPQDAAKSPGDEEISALPRPDAVAGTPGVLTGRPLTWLRVEALAVAAAALVGFATTGQPWWLVPALFLVPDLSALGYLAGRRVGAWTYNLAHTAPLPLALLAAGAGWHISAFTVAGAVGLFHLGVDRVLKYGVKYDHNPGMTHLSLNGDL